MKIKAKAKEQVKKVEAAKPALKAPVAKLFTKPAAKTAAKPAAKPVAQKAAPKTQRVPFSVRAEVGSKVFIAGSFNNWDPTDKEMTDKNGDGNFTATLTLGPGAHQYKFVIDGTWCADPECADWIQNAHGTLNSVKHVG